jgi:hypothetical protein
LTIFAESFKPFFAMFKTFFRLALLLALTLTIKASAQPAFTATNFGKIGDRDTVWSSPYVPLANDLDAETGSGFTWDFTNLTFLPNMFAINQFRAPQSNSSKAFPDATIELFNGADTWLAKSSNDTLYQIRQGDEVNGTVFDPPVPHRVFPIQFGATYQVSQDQYVASHAVRAYNRSITAKYDGYGTLKLKWGTYPNVMRIAENIVDSSVIQSVPSINRYKTYYWYQEGSGIPLLRLRYTGADVGGQHTYFTFASKGAAGPVAGVAESSPRIISLYPNPAHDILHVQSIGQARISLMNTLGEMVLSTAFEGSHSLDVRVLPAGVYFARIESGKDIQRAVFVKK